MGGGGVLLVGAAEADVGAYGDQGGSGCLLSGRFVGRVEGLEVVAVLDRLDMPAVGFVALADIFGEGQGRRAIDRDAVVVVGDDQFAQSEVTRERRGLGSDPFHQVAITGEDPDVVVEEGEAVAIEVGGQHRSAMAMPTALASP